jgi:transcriptional regulator with XRE-family HTH domain
LTAINVEVEVDGSRVRAVRELKGLGLREAALRASIDPGQLSRFERGIAGLGVRRLRQLALVLELGELERALRPFVGERRN